MTITEARAIAQSDPVPALSKRWGEITADTRKAVQALETKLRELDKVTADLGSHDLVVATDLGPTGNAARAAFQAALADRGRDVFELPKAV